MIRFIKKIINKVNNINDFKGDISVDKNVIVRASQLDGKVTIRNNSKIVNSVFSGNISVGEHCKVLNAKLSGEVHLGRYTSIAGEGTTISSQFNEIEIGNFCSIASNCTMLEFNHPISKLSTFYINKHVFNEDSPANDRESKGPIKIGNDVWIGANVVILSGVKIGNGAIIGSNSVLTKDIPEYAVVGGVPAKLIKYRFEDNIIEKLLALKWWDWPIEKIRENAFIFQKDKITLEDFDKIIIKA